MFKNLHLVQRTIFFVDLWPVDASKSYVFVRRRLFASVHYFPHIRLGTAEI